MHAEKKQKACGTTFSSSLPGFRLRGVQAHRRATLTLKHIYRPRYRRERSPITSGCLAAYHIHFGLLQY